MNRTLTMHTAVAPSLADMAQRLELFEIGLLQEKVEELNEQLERQTAQSSARERVIQTALEKQRTLEAEVKRLKELDPDRTRKRADRLKRDKAELQQANTTLRTSNQLLTRKNRELDAALNKATKIINAGNAVPPILTTEDPRTGRWAIYSTEREGRYDILDITNDVSQTVTVLDDAIVTPKMRPLPKALHKTILEAHQAFFGAQNNV